METPNSEDFQVTSEHPPMLSVLKSDKASQRLNQIDQVRSKGIGDHIALPQLVVCGDQSAGKSSVLEGITGIPFPKKDGLCTRFATEIVVRHSPETHRITASLIPAASRSEQERRTFENFRCNLSGFDELANVIEAASTLFGVRGYNDLIDAPAFAADVLRLEVVGDTGLHLTIVDLPGLISVSDNEEDVKMVHSLVESYMESPRTIILAVVQASNDIDTQGIIQRARQYDKSGQRTVGIVTKPDLINEGTEQRIALLSHNMDNTKLKLGFFLLKNPTPTESKTIKTPDQRKRLEERFFSEGAWKYQNLNRARVGVSKLRSFCQDLLEKHIERELPKVRQEIKKALDESDHELGELGNERSSISELRFYVTEICKHFGSLTQDASDGKYNGADRQFFQLEKNGKPTLLRAKVHELNEEFAATMRQMGEKRCVRPSPSEGATTTVQGMIAGGLKEESYHQNENDIYDEGDAEGEDAKSYIEDIDFQPGQIEVTRGAFEKWVKTVHRKTRGLELPGATNPHLLWALFCEQSERWDSIATAHVRSMTTLVSKFANECLAYVVKDERVRRNLRVLMREQLEKHEKSAKQELIQLLQDEKGPAITYNHYYTDNVQHARQEALQSVVDISFEEAGRNNGGLDRNAFQASMERAMIADMEGYTCTEASNALNSYYQVAMKTFVDNVCRQVVERHTLRGLKEVLDPTRVSQYSDEYLTDVASETPAVQERRKELQALKRSLQESLDELSI